MELGGVRFPSFLLLINPTSMYRALKNFIHNRRRVKVGEKIKLSGSEANRLQANGCVYETKEEKRVYDRTTKATIEHDGGPMFLVKKGNQVVDRLKKSEAEQLRDEINGD